MSEEKNMNIYQRMSAITSEISAVAKNLSVGFGKSSYKATGEADVLAAVKPIEAKFGVYSYPVSRKIIDSGEMVSKKQSNGQEYESRQLYMRIECVYRFVNVDKPEEYIELTVYGDGVDSQDKAPGKAMTYADKYALLKAYKIITGDDPDQNKSAELVKTTPAERLTEKEVAVLKSLCEKRGLDVTATFPGGVENLTPSQYVEAAKRLGGGKE